MFWTLQGLKLTPVLGGQSGPEFFEFLVAHPKMK